jgi:hypothetical protein
MPSPSIAEKGGQFGDPSLQREGKEVKSEWEAAAACSIHRLPISGNLGLLVDTLRVSPAKYDSCAMCLKNLNR